jgi:hypothetical protein
MASFERPPPPKARTKVKPMLRKLTQSEKNSLDLDRPAELQDGLGIYDYGTGSRSAHDVNYRESGRRGYHARSTSGTSQFSTGTGGSHRTGSFVHPFQQTPRPYTPPISAASYQNSLRESEQSQPSSPILTEDEDRFRPNYRSTSNLSNRAGSITGGSSTKSPIISQPLRIQTSKTQPTSSSRLALATSHTSLHNSLLSPADIVSPAETMSPSGSTFRSSIDKGFRLRSRSEVDTRTHAQQIADARRKFQEKEQAKEERAARAEIAALEKRQRAEARQIERGHRRSSASDATRSKPGTRGRSESNLTMEKVDGFVGRDYGSQPLQTPPALNESHAMPRRQHTVMSETKKKTNSAWHKLMMWIRTRFIRMGSSRKRERSDRNMAGVF